MSLFKNPFNIKAMSETWIRPDKSADIEIDGYGVKVWRCGNQCNKQTEI